MTFAAVILLILYVIAIAGNTNRAYMAVLVFAPAFSLFPNTNLVGGFNPIEISSIIGVIVLVRITFSTKNVHLQNGALIVVFLSLSLLSSLLGMMAGHVDILSSIDFMSKTIIAYMVYWTGSRLALDAEERVGIYEKIVLSTLAVSIVFMITYYIGGFTVDISRGVERFASLYNDPGTPAYYAVISVLIHSYLMEKAGYLRSRKWLYIGNNVLTVFILLLTLTRSAMIMYALYLLTWHGIYKRRATIIVPILVAAPILLYMEDESFRGRFEQEVSYAEYGDIHIHRLGMGRVTRWMSLLDMYAADFTFTEQLFGHGISYGAHNNYLAYLLHLGAVGLLVFILIIVTFASRLINLFRKIRSPETSLTLSYLVILLVYAMTGHPFYYTSILWYLMYMLSHINGRISSGPEAEKAMPSRRSLRFQPDGNI